MPCERVTIPGPEPEEADRASVSDINVVTDTNVATLEYTVNNPNNFAVQVEIKESITNTQSGQELDSNNVTVTVDGGGSTRESVQFGTNLGGGESMTASLCADVRNTVNAGA